MEDLLFDFVHRSLLRPHGHHQIRKLLIPSRPLAGRHSIFGVVRDEVDGYFGGAKVLHVGFIRLALVGKYPGFID